jgi:hypothetical protein
VTSNMTNIMANNKTNNTTINNTTINNTTINLTGNVTEINKPTRYVHW